MLQYPSIPSWRYAPLGRHCIAYYKYDGSNLRFEWSYKRGWYKFGTRHTMYDERHPEYGQAISMFKEQIGDYVSQQCQYVFGKKLDRVVAFCEFFGPSSFAGAHVPEEPKQLVLLDVSTFKRGFMFPGQFNTLFGKADFAPKIVYEGAMDESFINNVREGKYPVYEGVVCKGSTGDWKAKIKTIDYLERLKRERYGMWEEEQSE